MRASQRYACCSMRILGILLAVAVVAVFAAGLSQEAQVYRSHDRGPEPRSKAEIDVGHSFVGETGPRMVGKTKGVVEECGPVEIDASGKPSNDNKKAWISITTDKNGVKTYCEPRSQTCMTDAVEQQNGKYVTTTVSKVLGIQGRNGDNGNDWDCRQPEPSKHITCCHVMMRKGETAFERTTKESNTMRHKMLWVRVTVCKRIKPERVTQSEMKQLEKPGTTAKDIAIVAGFNCAEKKLLTRCTYQMLQNGKATGSEQTCMGMAPTISMMVI